MSEELKELSKLVKKRIMKIDVYDDTSIDSDEARDATKDILELFEEYAKERELKGEFKCFDWIVQHDESSFRQERSWFKVKPRLLLERQAQIMRELESQNKEIK